MYLEAFRAAVTTRSPLTSKLETLGKSFGSKTLDYTWDSSVQAVQPKPGGAGDFLHPTSWTTDDTVVGGFPVGIHCGRLTTVWFPGLPLAGSASPSART